VDREGDTVVLSTASHRQKARNLEHDPRVSVSIFERANPYYSVEVRGIAELVEDPDRVLPARLSQKYLGEDPPPEPGVDRLIVRIKPVKVDEFSGRVLGLRGSCSLGCALVVSPNTGWRKGAGCSSLRGQLVTQAALSLRRSFATDIRSERSCATIANGVCPLGSSWSSQI
jgi:PPOX class probable F420-dependent enzyme